VNTVKPSFLSDQLISKCTLFIPANIVQIPTYLGIELRPYRWVLSRSAYGVKPLFILYLFKLVPVDYNLVNNTQICKNNVPVYVLQYNLIITLVSVIIFHAVWT